VRRAGRQAGRLAAVAVAGALALSGCGGGDGAEAPEATGSTAATATAPATTPAAAGPTLAASQEVVDLVNRYASEFSGGGTDPDPAELERRAARLREGTDAIRARIAELEAHPCVERLARGQASLMGTLSDLLQATAEGRASDAAALSEELRRLDQEAMLREGAACQASVGYRGPESE